MLNLTIHHNVHLTREERYALHDGGEVVVVGVSVPVWFSGKNTSEPGREVFCRYVLKNPRKETPIQILDDGYEVTIPYREGTKLKMSNEEWRTLCRENPAKLEAIYKMQVPEVSSANLLDAADGGCGCLYYRENNKVQSGKHLIGIMHYVCLNSAEHLSGSVVFSSP